jgi:hypothetical protein
VSAPVPFMMTTRSIRFSSSRMFPGQVCRISVAIASLSTPVTCRRWCSLARRMKCSVSSGMSERRWRSGGSSMGMTFSRQNRSARNRPAATSFSSLRLVAARMRTSTLTALASPMG